MDPIQITEEGIQYKRGVHVVSRRPELRIIAVDASGEIIREHTQSMEASDPSASDRVLALIETATLMLYIQELRDAEPWLPEIPTFVPPHPSDEAERTAAEYVLALLEYMANKHRKSTDRGLHFVRSKAKDPMLRVLAVTSKGERIAERRYRVMRHRPSRLDEIVAELKALLDLIDPV